MAPPKAADFRKLRRLTGRARIFRSNSSNIASASILLDIRSILLYAAILRSPSTHNLRVSPRSHPAPQEAQTTLGGARPLVLLSSVDRNGLVAATDIEGIAQAVAQEGEAEHDEGDREHREEQDVGIGLHE